MNPVDQGVREVMASVFGMKPKNIDITASPSTIGAWDSLQHLNLALALEEHFGIQFSVDEMASLNSYTAITDLISQRLHTPQA